MKKTKLLTALVSVLLILALLSGCSSAVPELLSKDITVEELFKDHADVFSKAPVSLTYTLSEGEPNAQSVIITDADACAKILRLLLSTKVDSKGCGLDMYIMKLEEFCFDFGDETFTFDFIPGGYVSCGGLYYEITEGHIAKVRTIIEEFEQEDDIEAVSCWYEDDAVLDTEFFDNGDEARSYTELTLYSSEGTLTGYIEGAYDILSIERQADCYIISYTYGDFYSHEQQRRCRVSAEDGELVVEDIE